MFSRTMARQWPRQLLVVLGYALAYGLFHDVLVPQYSLAFGLRLAILTITPYRYWPALVLGEALFTGYIAIQCMPDFGPTWSAFRAVPMILLVMPIVYMGRERFGLIGTTKQTNVPVLVLACLVAALTVAVFQDGLTFSVKHLPATHPGPLFTFVRFFLMNYVGALTFTPLMMCIREVMLSRRWAARCSLIQWRILTGGALGLVLVLTMLTWVSAHLAADPAIRNIAQIAMFVPVVVLALRYGWYGAAMGGAAAGFAVEALMASRYDNNGMQAQTLIAFAISTMLLLGKHITVFSPREQHGRPNSRLALATAQQSIQLDKQRFRVAKPTSWDKKGSLFRALQFGRYAATEEDVRYGQQTSRIIGQLDTLARQRRPATDTDRNVLTAISEDAVARALAAHCVQFNVEFHGRVSALSDHMHAQLFHVVGDAVVQMCDWQPVSEITVNVHARRIRGRVWIWVRVDGVHVANQAVAFEVWPALLARLEQHASPNTLEAIENTALAFQGRVRIRPLSQQTRLSVLLAQPSSGAELVH